MYIKMSIMQYGEIENIDNNMDYKLFNLDSVYIRFRKSDRIL